MKQGPLMITFVLLLAGGPVCAEDTKPAGDPDAGSIVFRKCMACPQLGEGAKNSTGPVLNGIVDRPIATYPGYNYSKATKNAGLIWNEDTLAQYLRAPREVVPGTRMAFGGLKKEREILDVIAYLKQFDAEGKKVTP
jgi:cytochrome c